MNHLGFTPEKLRFASFEFTCCEGCQLQLANHESSLPEFLDLLDIRRFRELSDRRFDDYDIAFVEGSITREEEADRLREIRQRAKTLVAFGTCACFGGVNSLKNRLPEGSAAQEVYDGMDVESGPSTRIADIVPVDLFIPGCPVAKAEVERIVVSLATRSPVSLLHYPVCVECKHRLNTCLFDLGEICLGPITRAGCEAVCPTGKTPCLGCRGPTDGINFPSFRQLVEDKGLDPADMEEKLDLYNAFGAYRGKED